MFTWICPECGAEVPPSYDECPKCAEKKKAAPQAPPGQTLQPQPQAPEPVQAHAVAPPPPLPYPPQTPPAPLQQPPSAYPQQMYTPPPAYGYPQHGYAQPVKQGPPAWLVTAGVAAAVVVLGYGLYAVLGSATSPSTSPAAVADLKSDAKATDPKADPFERPVAGNAAPKGAASNRPSASSPPTGDQLAKHLEAVGIRFTEESRRTVVTMAIVNHSGAEMSDLRGKIRILTKDGEKTVSTVEFKMPALGPYEVRDYTIPLLTTMRAYELPDWQFLKAEIELR